tara:strand:+ start:2758 stop:3231 length:474 start_codon:yes stop_codon:yes gene_type:complete
MNSLRKYIFFSIIIFLFSCEQKDPLIIEFDKAIEQSMVKDADFFDAPALFVIPNGGCEGCITSAESFTMDNIDNYTNLRVVFTGTNSQKGLRLKIGDDIYNHDQVFIDNSNLFYSPELISIYPTIVYLDNRRVQSITQLSPKNTSALSDFLEVLSKD